MSEESRAEIVEEMRISWLDGNKQPAVLEIWLKGDYLTYPTYRFILPPPELEQLKERLK